MFGTTGWRDTNVQPGREIKQGLLPVGICPHYELLKSAAELLGIDIDAEQQFCGQVGKGVNDIGFLSGRCGTEYEPVTFCCRVVRELSMVLGRITASDGFDLDSCLQKVTELFVKSDKKSGKQLVSELQQLTDARMARIDSDRICKNAPLVNDPARPRTKEEVLIYGQYLLDSLIRTIIGVGVDLTTAVIFGRLKCPQAPKRDFLGIVS